MKRIYDVRILILMSCLTLSLGCGGGGDVRERPAENATVKGKVTSGGSPVSNATISFEKVGLGAWGGEIGADGTYEVTLAPGEFNVVVRPADPSSPMSMTDTATIPEPPKRDDIPEKYRSASTSETTATITDGENTFDLELN